MELYDLGRPDAPVILSFRLGYGMIAEAAIQEDVAEGKLHARPIPSWVPERQIYAVRHRNKLISPALRMLWRNLLDNFA
ncbi:substrate-binding domain-containing protein [Paenibacillus sp. Y412MC10]|uniref:substrate-binding domain-containing protein n=2 Tax=Bacillales TaxID=1385 RepID=UPI0021B19C79|nr:substrate-binding domain-containing protein [Paenibacillus sp. Y412MC10]